MSDVQQKSYAGSELVAQNIYTELQNIGASLGVTNLIDKLSAGVKMYGGLKDYSTIKTSGKSSVYSVTISGSGIMLISMDSTRYYSTDIFELDDIKEKNEDGGTVFSPIGGSTSYYVFEFSKKVNIKFTGNSFYYIALMK